jgi:hypothetical protein
MAKKITALQLEADNPSDLVTLAIGQPAKRQDGAIQEEGVVVTEIVHNEGGLAGLYKHQMKSCYRVGFNNGVNVIVPSDQVKFLVVTEDEVVGG